MRAIGRGRATVAGLVIAVVVLAGAVAGLSLTGGSPAEGVTGSGTAAPPAGPARMPAASVRHGQAKPAGSDVAVLARGKGPSGSPATLVAYEDAKGNSCWGFADSQPGAASSCFGADGGPNGKSIFLQQVTVGGGEPPKAKEQFLYGAGPTGTATFQFTVDGRAPVDVQAQVPGESEADDLPYFAMTFDTDRAVTVKALDGRGKTLDSRVAAAAGAPPDLD